MKFFQFTTLLFVALLFGANFGRAQQTIQLQPYLSNLSYPVYVTNAKDDTNRMFVVQQGGIVKVVQPGATTTADFLNITNKVLFGGFIGSEQGLLGLAFHPQFANNRKFYVNYTRAGDGATVIAEFNVPFATPNDADEASERILLVIPQPFSNHNGGMIEFGADGFLYIGMGDGGSGNDPGNRAQNRADLLGKMLRIDVTASGSNPYTIPADNPFTGANTTRCDSGTTTAGNTCQEIWAIGLRNPFRWSFDRGGTRQLYAGDVGQGQLEEVDIITRGANYGWRVFEGTRCNTDVPNSCPNGIPQTAPIIEYFNSGSPRCAVTGGYVYRGRRGALTTGTYLFADYCTGEIMVQGAAQNPTVLLDTNRLISSFGEDENGEIYVVGLQSATGTVERIVNPSAVTPRNAVADFDGDLRTDLSIFRPSNGTWTILNSFSNSQSGYQFGVSTDRLAPADFDNDGKTDVAVFRDGVWYSLDSSNNAFRAFQFGSAGDVPVAADYDNDRRSDYAVVRPSSNIWYILQSSNGQVVSYQWGASGDKPVPADYNGDGRTDVAVFRPSNAVWYILQSGAGPTGAVWGAATDVPVAGDYDGDGRADIAVWRPSNGTWYAIKSGDNTAFIKQWGTNGDTPAPGDYDADGKIDPAVTRPQNTGGTDFKVWYLTRSLNGAYNRSIQYGLGGDVTVPPNDTP